MLHQNVKTTTLREMSAGERTGMFRLRYETFHLRLGWDVKVTKDGQEIDSFDGDGATYIIAGGSRGRVDACWRLLPTLGANMLRDVFPQLLHGEKAPAGADIWELSRFAIAGDRQAAELGALGFGELSTALMAESVRFAMKRGIARYVTVTSVAIERMLKKQGVNVRRLGPPIRVGQVLTVACFVEIDDMTRKALGC